ncbi:MAG: protein kinase [Polyangiaceae bacterium]|nr:protein kinase [Polyangiaceae bacterium]
MPARHVQKGQPVHEAEARGIQALVQALPDNYWVFSNIELPSDRRGQTFEHDAVVLAPHAVFSVELKSWGGRIAGNRDRWTLADGTVVQSPIPLVLAKARVLKGRLTARRRELSSVWVQGLVFLSAPDASAQITPDFADYVVTRDGLRTALTDPGWLGHPPSITATQRRAIVDYLNDGRAAQVPDSLADFRLVQRLAAEDRPFAAWLAERNTLTRERRVLHAYSIVGESEAERERLRAHALREATLHGKLRGGPDVLRYDTYFITQDDPQRIVLQFEDTTPLQPMDAWAKDRNPGLSARLAVATRLARALAWVHEKGLVHRRLSPEAVLVSSEDPPLEVRLCAFELARDLTGAVPTVTGSSLGDPTFRCTAPEVLKTGEATPRSDLFSLGATLVELFTGRSLFANVDEVLRPFTVLPLHVGERQCPRGIAELVAQLLAVEPVERPHDAAAVAERLEQCLRELTQKPARTELAPGTELRQTYELCQRLGRGATATTWKARQLQTDHLVVLKIADPEHAHYLQEEGRVLSAVQHPNLVRFHNVEPFEGGNLLVLEYVEGFTATLWAAAGDPLEPSRFLTVAHGLFGALGALHQAGWVHRDVKPDNVMLRDGDAWPKLLDLGLAARWPIEGDLAVGSIRYKDPAVYIDNRWTPANDLFAAFLVLYELLTGTHPFGGGAPEPNQAPTIQEEEFPEGFDAAAVERLAALFRRALSPVASERPSGAAAAIRAIEHAVGVDVSEATAGAMPVAGGGGSGSVPPPPLPDSVELGTPLSALALSTRAQGALARLGCNVVADLVGFDLGRARELRNVGSKTLRELGALCAQIAARWPGQPEAERAPAARLYPALVDDPRPLDALGGELTPAVRGSLNARGLLTVGDLAAMPPATLQRLPAIGPGKVERLRLALRRLAGREEVPETLADLDARLREELGAPRWDALSLVVGLHDGTVRSQSEVATAIGVSRQRVSQLTDLHELRAEASWAHYLVSVVAEALPRAGFATLEIAAQGLAARLPSGEGGRSPLGYARLAGLLLGEDSRASAAAELRWVLRPPWTEECLDTLRQRLTAVANWPPVARANAEGQLWDAAPPEVQRALVRWGADAAQLLDALLKVTETVVLDRVGALYTPPIDLKAALGVLRPALKPVVDTGTLLAEVQAAYQGVTPPPEPQEIDAAIEAAGYLRDGDRWVDLARVELPDPLAVPRVDDTIPTQQVAADHLPPVVASLASQVARGGFRVVALAPSVHHALGRRLAAWLGESVGAEHVRFVPIDRLVIDALKAHDLWKFVPYLEARTDADWRMFHAELAAALDDALRDAHPGSVTVLGNPSLLGPLGLMDWLSGFYEKSRGGKHGLIVLAVPGGIHEDRVRLNEKYNLPYTPDMAAVYLEATAPREAGRSHQPASVAETAGR